MSFEPKILPTNQFWGRRSGSVTKEGNIIPALKGGNYKPRTGKRPPSITSINIPKKWFAVNYKQKRGESSFLGKGRKAK